MQSSQVNRAKNAQSKYKHSLNNSTTKAQYSFSRASRFSNRSYQSAHDVRFYDVRRNDHLGNVSFGSSKRIDFVKKDGVPPSTYYNITNKLMSESNGIKFKSGRKECKSNEVFPMNKNPGPGSYNPESTNKYKAIKYSIGKRYKTIAQDLTPGPQYEIPSTLSDDKKILSTQLRRNSTKICNPIRNLFPSKTKEESRKAPLNSSQIESTSMVITRKGKKSIGLNGTSAFIKPSFLTHDKSTQQIPTPGPGTYNSFSQFLE